MRKAKVIYDDMFLRNDTFIVMTKQEIFEIKKENCLYSSIPDRIRFEGVKIISKNGKYMTTENMITLYLDDERRIIEVEKVKRYFAKNERR